MFYIFEMANNHQGSVAHAKLIIDQFAAMTKKYDLAAAVKLQFRQLGSFIHKDYANSDLKYVKRFKDTELSKEQFREIVQHIKQAGLKTVATPFDNESLPWLEELDISVVKIASCSVDDWPLLNSVSDINKKIIISTAGAKIEELREVYTLFKKKGRDFAFMHCVGEYPTPTESANLNRINTLRDEFPDIEIGFSTHESPKQRSLAPVAMSMGCTIIEKHVGVETDEIKLNTYSCTPDEMEEAILQINEIKGALVGESDNQRKSLKSLKRGIYASRDINPGDQVNLEDLYFAMPVREGQLDASNVREILNGFESNAVIKKDSAVLKGTFAPASKKDAVAEILSYVRGYLNASRIPISKKDDAEISAHFGIEGFGDTGVFIINKINREYCKKLLVVFPGQTHPTHHHIKKEESFELLNGDCVLTLNDKEIVLEKGNPVLIPQGVAHSFKSEDGCIIEEVSTTHIPGDSVYRDPEINKLKLSERKIVIKNLMEQW